jgi:hypothetical protein
MTDAPAASAPAANGGDKQSTTGQIISTTIAYINIFGPAWSDADRQKLKLRLLFYIPFYLFIAALYFLWVHLFFASIEANTDGKRPLLHGRGIQSPGINYVPRLMNSNSKHLDYIKDVHKEIDDNVAFSYKSGGGKIYSDAMQDWLDGEGYELKDYGDFGECDTEKFGFDSDKPCLFIKINKVRDWEPKGIEAGDIDEFFKSGDSNLMSSEGYCSESRFGEWCTKARVEKKKEAMKKQIFSDVNDDEHAYKLPFVTCMVTAGASGMPITYYPSNGRMNFTTPFGGNDPTETRAGGSIFAARNSNPNGQSSQKYMTPLVAVQFDFTDNKYKGKDILVHCFVFDRNMEIETDDKSSGMIEFFMNVNK